MLTNYPSDSTDEQWEIDRAVFSTRAKQRISQTRISKCAMDWLY